MHLYFYHIIYIFAYCASACIYEFVHMCVCVYVCIGVVTMLFTDIQGSTSLWEQCPMAMNDALSLHDRIMRESIAQFFGYEVTTGTHTHTHCT